jgi:hypothetical protein
MEKDMQLCNSVKSALMSLQKAETLLTHLTKEYVFSKNPNPSLILDRSISESNQEKREAQKWLVEYHYVTQFIEMTQDYVLKTKAELEKSVQTYLAASTIDEELKIGGINS